MGVGVPWLGLVGWGLFAGRVGGEKIDYASAMIVYIRQDVEAKFQSQSWPCPYCTVTFLNSWNRDYYLFWHTRRDRRCRKFSFTSLLENFTIPAYISGHHHLKST